MAPNVFSHSRVLLLRRVEGYVYHYRNVKAYAGSVEFFFHSVNTLNSVKYIFFKGNDFILLVHRLAVIFVY